MTERADGEPTPILFERQAATTPQAVAVISAAARLSYAELNERANRFAHLLIERGVGPDDVVALALPRGAGTVVAMLGVLKAGAAYLPVDPENPPERNRYVITDAAPSLVVCDRATPPPEVSVPVVDPSATGGYPRTNPADTDRTAPLLPGHPAYVVYTSGSTGAPKGVTGLHEGLVNRLLWFAAEFPEQRGRAVLGKTSLGFIDGTTEILGTLVTGGTLVIAEETSLVELPERVRQHGIERLTAVPSALNELVRHPEVASLDPCRFWISSGEQLTPALAAAFAETFPGARLINLYGASEISGDSLWSECSGADAPIGTPISGTRTHVLDQRLHPVRPGETGELYIAGSGLARGYRGRAALTAERFVAEIGGPPGSRMYRTGDLVRQRPDGALEHLGRLDDQLEIRGVRIEIGEIAAVLERHPAVGRATAAEHGDRLVGYVLAESEVDTDDVREHARATLPAQVVPDVVVALESFPVTASGKLDRRALPEPEFRSGRAAARDSRESALCRIFAETLRVSAVGTDDDFLSLGGHSLAAVRIVNRVRSDLGARLDMGLLFEQRTVAELARELDTSAGEHRPPLPVGPRPDRVPLSANQEQLWFLSRLDGSSALYNLPHALELSGELRVPVLAEALRDVVQRHESLRTVFPDDDGVPRQVVLDAEAAAPVPELVHCAPDELDALLSAAAAEEFDLVNDPPFRAAVYSTGTDEQVLLLVTHHIASDGWSFGPLVRDLATAYAARAAGRPPEWSPLPVQYGDFAVWQREFLGAESSSDSVLARRTAWWTGKSRGLPEQLELPTDRDRPAIPSHLGGIVTIEVGAETRSRIREIATEHRATTFMVLHAALIALLTRLGVGTDVPVGTVVAGRDGAALEDTVGFFANTLVLRGDTSGNPAFAELLDRVRDDDLEAFAHQDMPFGRLVSALNPPRHPARHPLFQILLELDDTTSEQPRLAGTTPARRPVHIGRSRFDLAFEFLGGSGDTDPEGLSGTVEYNADLFERSSVQRLVQRLVRVLEAVARDPQVRLGRIDILGDDERRELLGK
ncbi:MAG: amino acid adenylation domain-containing protein [Saccharopolyspora sp.]|uniref:amino acid adenylation domain-containing protein n=1 Tax=Saccharopolyspora sp. TaxID=33915 RepID=UPI0025D30689|nr:amino acid adenylation domain-containing protein [Saccharopolyspora sp.]MBQ6642444.1 amino acid adenylation domain-containing protein [Saccharopolyspora sp.]